MKTPRTPSAGPERRPAGFSLLELVVAAAVFTVAFVMLLGVFPTAARAVRQGQEYLAATFLAERRLEEVRAMAWDDLATTTSTVEMGCTNAGLPSSTSYSVQTLVSEPEAGLKRVRVLVSWTGERARHVEVCTHATKLH